MSPFELYCILKLDALRNILTVGAGIGVLSTLCGAFACVIFTIDENTDETPWKRAKSACKWGLATFALLGSLCSFTPSTKEYVAMITVPAIVNSERVQALPTQFLDLLDSKIKELMPTKDKK